MKSLVRMSSASVLQAQRLYNAAAIVINTGFQPGESRTHWFQPFQRLRSMRAFTGLKAGVNWIILLLILYRSVSSGRESEPEQKRLAAAGVSQRLLIRRAQKLIAQPEPAAQLCWRLCGRSRPTLACEVCTEFSKRCILSKGQQCDARAFRHG